MKALSLLVRKLWPRLKFFKFNLQGQGQKLQYHVKGLVTRNTHVQYKSSITSAKKVMDKVKDFVHVSNANAGTRAMTLFVRLAKKLMKFDREIPI